MSPKTAHLSLALLSLILTLTVSSATANGGCEGSLQDILKSYDLPPTIFPKPAEKTFTCTALKDNAVSIKFTLHRTCKVTRTALVVKNVLTCAPEISATVSYRQISNIEGITVSLYISILGFNFPFPYLPEIMTVTDAKVFDTKDGKKLQFIAKEGNSPPFPVEEFPDHPPTCDAHATLGYFFVADTNHQDIPNNQQLYNNYKYGGRPLFPLLDA